MDASTQTLDVPLRRERAHRGLRARWRTLPRPLPELAGLMALAALLNLWALSRNGWANDYYSAAVRSMSSSWHNFLFGSFDANGLMTVDKPPLALWVQALSVRVFGFHPLSILVPQALMGVASVALVYDLTRRLWGRPAGFAAGLALALTPIAVAISRHNNPDALLVLCSVSAIWCFVRALQDGRTRWLVLVGISVGLGFETKMAVALMVVPGIAAAWLWIAPRGRLAALRQLLAGGAALVLVGGAWPLLVTLTPAADRPWISGTSDNSVWSLIFGYNGLARLQGQAGGPAGGFGAGTGPFGGSPGVLRLLNASLGGQAGWLLGFALVAGVGGIAATRLRRKDPRSGWLIALGGAFLTTAVAFSYAQGIFHPYYVSLLAPFAAALVGAGVGLLLARGRLARVLAPLAFAGGIATELAVLGASPTDGLGWLPLVLVIGGAGLALALAAGRLSPRAHQAALAAALGLLLFAPGVWAVQTLGHATSGTFPAGGPASAALGGGGPGGRPPIRALGRPLAPPPGAGVPFGARPGGGPPGGAPGGGNERQLTQALAYIRTHGGGTLGVSSQQGAAGAILASGAHIAGLGGFSGRESQVSLTWLSSAISSGRLRWVLSEGGLGAGLPGDTRVGASTALAAVAEVCTRVTTTTTSTSGALYDCQGKASALAKLT
jgi:4-amino-4-deoxy-L-arabinose transferase-like glycosyltransferase